MTDPHTATIASVSSLVAITSVSRAIRAVRLPTIETVIQASRPRVTLLRRQFALRKTVRPSHDADRRGQQVASANMAPKRDASRDVLGAWLYAVAVVFLTLGLASLVITGASAG